VRFRRDFYAANRSIPTVFETCSHDNLSLEELKELSRTATDAVLAA